MNVWPLWKWINKWNQMELNREWLGIFPNFLFCAENKVMQFLMLLGPLFHSLAASQVKEDWVLTEWPVRTRSPLVMALVHLEPKVETCFVYWMGYVLSFVDFHISKSLTCAFIWLTESILRSIIMFFVLIFLEVTNI